jgi:hypothetical protein
MELIQKAYAPGTSINEYFDEIKGKPWTIPSLTQVKFFIPEDYTITSDGSGYMFGTVTPADGSKPRRAGFSMNRVLESASMSYASQEIEHYLSEDT